MTTTRRNFLKLSALAGGSIGLGLISSSSSVADKPDKVLGGAGKGARAPRSLRILILGGTGFTGPFQVRYALERGHKVTVFNRGRTHPRELPREVEQLIGDRNGQL